MSQHRAVGSPWYCAKEERMGRRSRKGNVSTRGTERKPRAGRAVAKDPGSPDRLETDKQWPLAAHVRVFWVLLKAGAGLGSVWAIVVIRLSIYHTDRCEDRGLEQRKERRWCVL